jgi:hypothetical protein
VLLVDLGKLSEVFESDLVLVPCTITDTQDHEVSLCELPEDCSLAVGNKFAPANNQTLKRRLSSANADRYPLETQEVFSFSWVLDVWRILGIYYALDLPNYSF